MAFPLLAYYRIALFFILFNYLHSFIIFLLRSLHEYIYVCLDFLLPEEVVNLIVVLGDNLIFPGFASVFSIRRILLSRSMYQ